MNVNIVDVRNGMLADASELAIRGASIEDQARPDPQQHGTELVVDLGGRFLIPGLIDMHVHSCADPTRSVVRRSASLTDMGINAARNLAVALAAGVTSVRDLGAGPEAAYAVKRAWQERRLTGARPFVAGPMITAAGGHGVEPEVGLGIEVTGEVEVTRAVRTAVGRGADLVKLVASAAHSRTSLNRRELAAGVAEAHRLGVRCACHANLGIDGLRDAVEAGCDSLEHGCDADEELLRAMAEKKLALTPTLAVFHRIVESPEAFGGARADLPAATRRRWEAMCCNVQRAQQLGVALAAGSDAGMPGVAFDALHTEMALMVACGLTRSQALHAATAGAAQILGRADLGALEPGRLADVVVAEGNPLDDLEVLLEPAGVLIGGRVAHDRCGLLRPLTSA